jgi:hypothetical protein
MLLLPIEVPGFKTNHLVVLKKRKMGLRKLIKECYAVMNYEGSDLLSG